MTARSALVTVSPSTPTAAAGSADYPINENRFADQGRKLRERGGRRHRVLYGAHTPRSHPSDFRVRTLDGVADDWPIDYATLAPFCDLNGDHDGHFWPCRRSCLPTRKTAGHAAAADGPRPPAWRSCARLQPAGLALGGPPIPLLPLRNTRAGRPAANLAQMHLRLRAGAMGSTDITYGPERSVPA